MKLGAHLWIEKGRKGVIEAIDYLNCNCFQMFLSNPRRWNRRKVPEKEIIFFKEEIEKRKISPFVVHMPYLLNLASPENIIYKNSLKLFMEEIEESEKYGAEFYVIHPGSNPDKKSGLKRLCSALKTVRTSKIKILIENTSGAGNQLCGDIEDWKCVFENVDNIYFCLDTAHLFQYGYKINSEQSFYETVEIIEKNIPLRYILLIHANDSATECGKKKDRHYHIGKGFIGINGFCLLIKHDFFGNLPFIIETPKDPLYKLDKMNLETLRKIGEKYGKI